MPNSISGSELIRNARAANFSYTSFYILTGGGVPEEVSNELTHELKVEAIVLKPLT